MLVYQDKTLLESLSWCLLHLLGGCWRCQSQSASGRHSLWQNWQASSHCGRFLRGKDKNILEWVTWINCQQRNMWQRERREHYRVCGWCGPPPACSSSRTSSPTGGPSCGFVARCSGPGSHTPSACRCSGQLIHCGDVQQIHSISIPACMRQFRKFTFNMHTLNTTQQSIVVLIRHDNSYQHVTLHREELRFGPITH